MMGYRLAISALAAGAVWWVFGGVAAAAPPHEFGEVVDYPLVVPVDGDYELWDTFWAARGNETGVHHAQDLMADKGVPVVAVADGVIEMVNWSSRPNDLNPDRCCSLVLRHDDGWESWYIHLDNDSPGTDDGKGWGIADGIVPGTRVSAGQLLGWVGDSGTAEMTPPHVHFELRDPDGVIVNPFAALHAAASPGADDGGDPLFDGSRALRNGDRGADVRRLQEVLTELGYTPGPVDGIFGAMTESAVTAFQDSAGLERDGIVGRATRGALESRLPEPSPPIERVLRKGDRGADVATVQETLAGAGFDPGPIDGIFGAKTQLAVMAFQEDRSLEVDGLVGPQTLGALGL